MQALKLETKLNQMNITENNNKMPRYLRSNPDNAEWRKKI